MDSIVIQNLIFPKETKHMMCTSLFYRGNGGYLNRENETFLMGKGEKIDLTTYLNSCPWSKWKKYTNAEEIAFLIEFEGNIELCFVGYSLINQELERKEFETRVVNNEERATIRIKYPSNNETIIGVEVTAIDDSIIYGGRYEAEYEGTLNDVFISIATTTCNKEEYIKKNVQLIKNDILSSQDEIRDHLTMHVVDNGNTLNESDINGRNVYLHSNINAGGSGGFARGMIESLHQNPVVTHVILMDDDVLILPESIKRTYCLLKLLKENYKDYFISGAMLKYERPAIQHEDIGTVQEYGWYEPLKPSVDLSEMINIVRNEGAFFNAKFMYAAWWYCCIPISQIRNNGLPLPFFIRGDDSEYSLRCKANILTMNGICIWHQDFEAKYNAAVDIYLQKRNMMIAQAASTIMQSVDLHKCCADEFYRKICKFEYGAAELALQAFEDYLKGPSFIQACNGEELLREKRMYNEKKEDLSSNNKVFVHDIWDVYADEPRKFIDKLFYHLTINGHRFTPEIFLKKQTGITKCAFGGTIQTQKITRKKEYVAIDVFSETYSMRKLDKEKGKDLIRRYKRAEKYYKRNHEAIDSAYRESQPYLSSEKFWTRYLGLDLMQHKMESHLEGE